MADTNLTTFSQAGLNVGYMSYNVTQPPFDKAEVRHALNMAIDKDALIKAIFQDAGAVGAENLIPPTMWSWNKDVKSDAYNPDEAKKVFNEEIKVETTKALAKAGACFARARR